MVIVEMPPNKDWVTVSASISSIEKCFQTKLASWENSRSGLVRDGHIHAYSCTRRYVVIVVVVTAAVVAATYAGLIFIPLIIIVIV